MSNGHDLDATRREILRLRARIVVLERMAMASLELVLRVRPEELGRNFEMARERLGEAYESATFAAEVENEEQRQFLAAEVERYMRGVQADLGLVGGVDTPERG